MLGSALISCGDKTENTKAPSKNPSTSGGSGEPSSSNSTQLTDEELALVNNTVSSIQKEHPNGFEGKDFNFVGKSGSSFPTEDNITGQAESDSVYKRNMAVQDALDIKIVNVETEKGPDAAQMIMTDVQAGLNTYHCVFGNIWSTGIQMFNEGYLEPMSEFSQINIENPWWLSTMEDCYAIGDKLFLLSGDILPDFFNNSSCVLFSKKLMEDYGITDDLYSIVKDGDWTLDKLFEVASNIPAGGGSMRYGNSDYGAGQAIYFGAGLTITKFDADHMPSVDTTLSKELVDLAAKVSSQTGDESISYNTGYEKEELQAKEILDQFADDKVLFLFATAADIAELRNEDVNGFGILPIPKGSESQETYVSLTNSGDAGSIYIPRNVEDKDMVGSIIETMGAYSYQYIRPAFYDQRLKSKSVYDLESKDMLDIIYATQVYDLYDLYGGGSYETGNGELAKLINQSVYLNDENLSSKYSSLTRVTQNKIKAMIRIANSFDK